MLNNYLTLTIMSSLCTSKGKGKGKGNDNGNEQFWGPKAVPEDEVR